MKASAVLIFALLTVAVSALTPEEEDGIFSSYLNQYNIRLGRSDDVERRKRNLITRYHEIAEHNAKYESGEESYQLGINAFSMYTYEELIAEKTGSMMMMMNGTSDPLPTNRRGRAAPASFSWLSRSGVVRPVQNQGSCGSCWAFGGIGALEGQLAIKHNVFDKLSEQEVIECARNKYNGALLGCNGGWGFSVYDHARDRNGVASDRNRPYRATTSSACSTSTTRVAFSKVSGYVQVPNDEYSIKEYLYSYGPLYITYHVSNDFFSYQNGVYTDSKRLCSGKYNNHAVLLVGYGTQNGIDYWLLKNSWGTWFGENGYFKLRRNVQLCGISRDASFPNLAN